MLTIINEFNCYEKDNGPLASRILFRLGLKNSHSAPGYSSIWICPAEYDADSEEHEYTEMCTKIVGPVHSEECAGILSQLKQGLTNAGIVVKVEEAADD